MLGFGDQQVSYESQLCQALWGAPRARGPWLELWGTYVWLMEYLESVHREWAALLLLNPSLQNTEHPLIVDLVLSSGGTAVTKSGMLPPRALTL